MPPLPSRVARLLLAYLVLRAGNPQPRSVLADLFWPDTPESRGRRRLSHALWQLQDALAELCPGQLFIQATQDAVTFVGEGSYWLDVEEFETRLDRVDAAETPGGVVERELRRCVDLYRGDLLAGHYEPWVATEQQRLEQRYLTALSQLVEVCRAQGNFRDALTFARRVTHLDPLREDGHREVMRLSVLLDQPSQALEQYERCRSVLAEELGTEPAAETVALYERIAAARTHVAQPSVRPRQLVSDHLVGRKPQRTVLVDLLERALAGRSGIAMVEGPPGVGKSQLLTQLADDATWRGFTVCWGTCQDTSAPTAYGPVRDALAVALQPVRVAQLRHTLDPVWVQQASGVLGVFGARDDAASGRHGAPAPERSDMVREALCQVLVELSRQDPVLLVIDDVQWADTETLALLAHFTRRADAGRTLVLLGFRDQEARADDTIWEGLRLLDRNAMPQRVGLGPLSAFEVGELIADVLDLASVPAGFTAAVHRESGGNPLYALELLRALRDSGTLTQEAVERLESIDVPVTDGLRTVVAQRLDALPAVAVPVMEAAAVLGSEFALEVLEAACGVSEHDIARALTALTEFNVLEPSDDRYRFTHAVTRRVVLDGIGADRRRDLHGQAADALEVCQVDAPEDVAGHLLAAAQPRRAVPYLQRAADRALRVGAYTTAEHHLARAITATRQGPATVDLQYALLIQHEEVLDVLGRRGEQAGVLDALEALAAGHADREMEVGLRRALLLGHLDRLDDALLAATTAGHRAAAISDAARARADAVLGQLQSWAGLNSEAIATLRRAVSRGDDDESTGTTRFALGTALRFVQRYDEAELELRLALELADRHDDQPGIVRARGALADLHTEVGQWDVALREYEQTIAAARRLGYRQREAVGLVNQGNLHQSRGAPADAIDAYGAAEGIFEQLDSERGIAMVRLNRSWLRHRWLGEDVKARDDAEKALAHFTTTGNLASGALCLETLAAIERRRGRYEESHDLLRRALTQAEAADEHRAVAQIHRGLAATAHEDGDLSTARTHARMAIDLATHYGLHDLESELHARLARVLLAEGEPEAAWEEATRALGRIGHVLEPHRVHHAIAQVARTAGHDDTACHHLQQAHERLLQALSTLDERQRERALTVVRTHREIVTAATDVLPQVHTRRFARAAAPRGRPLTDQEIVPVPFRLGPRPTDADQRRRQIQSVIEQVRAADAVPTVTDLAEIFDVSTSTIHRDLRALRSQGIDATTRGTGVG